MKIAVNTRLLRKDDMDGIGLFTYNTLKEITVKNPDIEFHFFFDSGIDNEFLFSSNITPHNLFPPAKHAILNIIWFEWSVKQLLTKINPDLFFSPDGILCLGWEGKQYTVLHDVNFEHRPKDLKFSNRLYYKYFIPRSAKKACRLGTVSEYSKNDIVQTYNVQSHLIDVMYLGVNELFSIGNSEAEQKKLKEKYAQGCDFFLSVGTIQPRKNIFRLMQSFDLFKRQTKASIKLLIAGKELYRTKELHDLRKQLPCGQDIVFVGRVDDVELSTLFAASLCLVFIPLFEGFGLPAIEAMKSNTPVIASNVTSIPEIVGDAAVLVNPYNLEEIKDAMVKIYNEPYLRQLLIEKGSIRKQVFSWRITSENLWKSIQRCL